MFELASNQPSNSYGTTQVITWAITPASENCSLWDSDGIFYTSDSPDKVQGTNSFNFTYGSGTLETDEYTYPHSVTWTLSCPSLAQATAMYYVDSPGVLSSLSIADGSDTAGDGGYITFTWTFSDFPPGTNCTLSSTDSSSFGSTSQTVSISASTPTLNYGGGTGTFSGPTVGSDPVTSGTGYYQYSASDTGAFSARLTCNGITSTTSYTVGSP